MNKVDFSQKSLVVITGASKGIGAVIAVELARLLHPESSFLLIARSQDDLNSVSASIRSIKQSFNVEILPFDLGGANFNPAPIIDKIINLIDESTKNCLFFHNAGSLGELKKCTDLNNLQSWQNYFNFNLFNAVLLNNAFLNALQGRNAHIYIINITSLCGRAPFENLAMYGSGKAARELFFKVLAVENKDLTVLNYSPGPVETDMFEKIKTEAQSAEVRAQFEQVANTSVLKPIQTVNKLIGLLKVGQFKSGDTIDYFDQ